MQRSLLGADRNLSLPHQPRSEGLSVPDELPRHLGRTCLCHSVPSLLLGLRQQL